MRVHVLGIGAEGAWFDLDAELDVGGESLLFYGRIAGISFDDEDDGTPSSRVMGPYTWPEVLEEQLRANRWMELHPTFLHPLVAHLVEAELPRASERGRERWQAALAKIRSK